jgi:hypothetical protein
MRERTRKWMLWGSAGFVASLFVALAAPSIAANVHGITPALFGAPGGNDHDGLALLPTSTSLTPNASGTVEFAFVHGVLSGHADVRGLPAAGNGSAYVLWYVNTATGDKAFLGPLGENGQGTILFEVPGNGHETFTADAFTAGPHAGMPISMAPTGDNLFILLVETSINFATPSPIGSAVSGTF